MDDRRYEELARRFADRVDRLFKPSRRKRAELAKALAAYAKAAREARRLTYELWASETEWFEGCKRQAADEQGIDLEYVPKPDPDPKLALFWELLEEFAYCEDTLLESAESADTIIRLIAAGMPKPGDGYASVKNQKVTLLDSTGQQMESKR